MPWDVQPRTPWLLGAQLMLDAPKSVAASAARLWFEGVPPALAPDLWPHLPADGRTAGQREIGDIHAELSLRRGNDGQTTTPFTVDGWRLTLAALPDRPAWAGLEITEVDGPPGPGRERMKSRLPIWRTVNGLAVEYSAVDEEDTGEYLLLGALTRQERLIPNADALLSAIRAVAEDSDPVYGEVAVATGSFESALERASFRWYPEMLRQPRTELRGYSWLTIAPKEVGDRLGGVAALRVCGAFHEVEELSAGGYWLLATPDFASFDQNHAERIFEALAPVLPPGQPHVDPRDGPVFLAERDPARSWYGETAGG